MLIEVMKEYNLVKEFRKAGYYETPEQKQLFSELKAAILNGKLVALTGIVGCGKTVTLRKLQAIFNQEGKILVSKSLAVEKQKATLPSLISALFYDLSPDKTLKIPSQGEKRERQLRELICKKRKKPVALFIDEAHDLYSSTLTGLKRIIEVVEDGGGTLSVLLVGHPKLRNDLRRPTMEEIGYRTAVFSLDGLIGSRREYIEWLLSNCMASKSKWQEVITPEAVDLLATKLRTPLQIEQHLSLAFESAYQTGEKPITDTLINSILSKQIDDLEPTLTRHGYNVRNLAQQFNTKPAEIRLLFKGQLDPIRAQDLKEQMLAAGLPI
ncbi:MAG: AAA family ATPase [Waterburya sp.]